MKLGILMISIVLGVSSCEGGQVCISGTRTTTRKNMTTSSATMGTVCDRTKKCILATVSYERSGIPTKLEHAACFNTHLNKQSCKAMARSFGISAEPTCWKKKCKTFACNHFAPAKGCSFKALAGDIQILPNCTLKGYLHDIYKCTKPMMAGYPYASVATCTGKIDLVYQCLRNSMISCLSGHCSTILDALPIPLQQYYSQIKTSYQSMTSYSSALASLHLDSAKLEQAKTSLCVIGDSVYSDRLQDLSFDQLLGLMNMDTTQLEARIKNPVCDSKDLIQLFRQAFTDVIQLYSAKNHAEFCRPMMKLWNSMGKTWKNHCNRSAVLDYIRPLIPESYSPLYPEIVKAINITENAMFNSSMIPGCEDVLGTSGAVGGFQFGWSALQMICLLAIAMIRL